MISEATALLKTYEVIFWIHKRLHFFWMHKGRHPEFSLHMSVCLLWKKSLDAVFLVQNWMLSFMGLVFLSKLNKVQSFMKTKFFKAFFHENQTNVWYIRLQEEMYKGQNYHKLVVQFHNCDIYKFGLVNSYLKFWCWVSSCQWLIWIVH